MLFYKIDAILTDSEVASELAGNRGARTLAAQLSETSESFYQQSEHRYYLFVAGVREKSVTFGAILQGDADIVKLFDRYSKRLPFALKRRETEEITCTSLSSLLIRADHNGFIADDEEVLNAFGIRNISSRYGHIDYGEALLKEGMTIETATDICDRLLFCETMRPELERIYANVNTKKLQGHPVHYILRTDDRETRKTVHRTLLSALYAAGRIQNKRYCFLDYDSESSLPDQDFETLYKSCEGGAVILRYNADSEQSGRYARRSSEIIAALCETGVKYKNKVLTVICLPTESGHAKDEFLANWGSTSFVELYEDVVFGEKAEHYLKAKAKAYKIRTDKRLIPLTGDKDKGYTATDLNRLFDEWYDHKLRHTVYPQYQTAKTTKAILKTEKPKGSAYQELQRLIGLSEAKQVMNQALNYFKAQKLFADKGLAADRPSMHMLFTGNPGTAKTTVARLFAQIMKENNLLSTGHFVEVGRGDLVGKYVGHTAPTVQRAFRAARGGVLFIDEAYALVDDKDGLFGDEAINTIVQEMENHRDDVVVIFAGYPDKMDGFLHKNPGLRSRIAFHIPFEDYTTDELCQIAAVIAEDKGLTLSEEATEKLEALFSSARETPDFGNGRYVRNVIEKAKMAQANRLVSMDVDRVSESDIMTLCAEDICVPSDIQKPTVLFPMGFSA